MRLTRLVDGLMDFSQVEGGKLTGRFRPSRIVSLTADLASLFRSTIERSQIEYRYVIVYAANHVIFIAIQRVECDVTADQEVYLDTGMWEKAISFSYPDQL